METRPGYSYTCICIREMSALVQVMVCLLFAAKPLPEPKLTYCQIDPYLRNSIKTHNFDFMNMYLKYIVCNISSILLRFQCAKCKMHSGFFKETPCVKIDNNLV